MALAKIMQPPYNNTSMQMNAIKKIFVSLKCCYSRPQTLTKYSIELLYSSVVKQGADCVSISYGM